MRISKLLAVAIFLCSSLSVQAQVFTCAATLVGPQPEFLNVVDYGCSDLYMDSPAFLLEQFNLPPGSDVGGFAHGGYDTFTTIDYLSNPTADTTLDFFAQLYDIDGNESGSFSWGWHFFASGGHMLLGNLNSSLAEQEVRFVEGDYLWRETIVNPARSRLGTLIPGQQYVLTDDDLMESTLRATTVPEPSAAILLGLGLLLLRGIRKQA